MILSQVTVFVAALVTISAGMLGGWLLRCRFPNQPAGSVAKKRAAQKLKRRSSDRDYASDFSATARDPIGSEAAEPCVRNTFSLALSHRLAESTRRGEPLAVILAGIVNFQDLSECNGLPLGNEILDATGKLFIASVRSMDWVARFDATTFAFLLPNTSHTNSLIVAERLRTNLSAASLSVGKTPIRLTLSIGATESQPGDNGDDILRRAEEAMVAAMRAGGNCIESRVDKYSSRSAVML